MSTIEVAVVVVVVVVVVVGVVVVVVLVVSFDGCEDTSTRGILDGSIAVATDDSCRKGGEEVGGPNRM